MSKNTVNGKNVSQKKTDKAETHLCDWCNKQYPRSLGFCPVCGLGG